MLLNSHKNIAIDQVNPQLNDQEWREADGLIYKGDTFVGRAFTSGEAKKLCNSINAELAANDDKWSERFSQFEKIEQKFGPAIQRSEQQEWTPKQWKDGEGQPRNSWDIWCGKKVIVSDLNENEAVAISNAHNAELAAAHDRAVIETSQQTLKAIGEYQQQLAAERKKVLRLEAYTVELDKVERAERQQLLASLAAIDRVIRACDEELTLPYYKATNPPAVIGTFAALKQICGSIDLSALHQHDAEVRKPLVEDKLRMDWLGKNWIDFNGVTDRDIRTPKSLRDSIDALTKVKEGK